MTDQQIVSNRSHGARRALKTKPRFTPMSCLLIVLIACAACVEQLPDFRGPYLSWKRDPKHTMTITWEDLKDTSRVVKWGIDPTRIEESIAASSVKRRDDMYYHRTVTLSGLEADRRYYYTVPGVQETPVSFVTAPEEKSALFRFFVYGDSCEHHKERKNQHYDIAEAMVRAERDGPSCWSSPPAT